MVGIRGKHLDSQYTILFGAHLWHLPDQVWSEVDLWLDVDVSVARFCDGSDAPLHVLSVEFELCFGDVVVELLDGLGIVCALLVGDVLAGEVRRALAFCLVLRDVLNEVGVGQVGRRQRTRWLSASARRRKAGL